MGYLLGKAARDRIAVIDGMKVQPGEDQLKALGAAAASSGQVGLFHMVGVTPEAPTLDAAFQGRAPARTLDVTLDDLRTARQELTTSQGDELDLVTVGCPHLSLAEWGRLAALVKGRRSHARVRFLVTTSRGIVEQARQAGYLAAVEAFGGTVTVDTCPLATPMLPPEVRRVMTNSGKHAYYAPGLLNTRVVFAGLAECVRSAEAGRVGRKGPNGNPGQAGRGRRFRRASAGERRAALVLGWV